MPESLLSKEADHVEGFAPEVFWVTHGGKDELTERLAIRPTSEAIIMTMYAKWIDFWRDLPVLINQGTACCGTRRRRASSCERLSSCGRRGTQPTPDETRRVPRQCGCWTSTATSSRRPGDPGDPRAQVGRGEVRRGAGDLHDRGADAGRAGAAVGHVALLGDNFAKAFDITFQDKDGDRKNVHTTSWGLSWRSLGALIMVHGDDSGLIMPPRVAPTQVIDRADRGDDPMVREAAELLHRSRSWRFPDRGRLQDKSPGWKFNEWEMRGVPVRLEIGPRDVKNGPVRAGTAGHRARSRCCR
jgi:prolyl-tRNA synthetase